MKNENESGTSFCGAACDILDTHPPRGNLDPPRGNLDPPRGNNLGYSGNNS